MTVRWTVRPTPRPSRSETVAFAKQMTEGLSGGQTPSCAFLRTHFLFSFGKGKGFALPKEQRAVRTVVLNLTQKISAISCPLRQTLPPERSLRSAHRGVRRSQLIALPPGRRKLHIRWLLLPFQTATAVLGRSLEIRGTAVFRSSLSF